MNRTLKSAIALSLIGVTSCMSANFPAQRNLVKLDVSPRHPGIHERKSLLINNAVEWQEVWEQIHAGVSERPPLPSVDFKRHSLIVISLGSRPSGGFAVSMDFESMGKSKGRVVVTELTPSSDCIVIAQRTYPTFTALKPSPMHDVSVENKRAARPCS